MKIVGTLSLITFGGLLAIACGGAPPPTARLASSEAAVRSARELGAQNDPRSALHLKLADDELAMARGLMKDNENKRADLALQRASSDAELAIILVREKNAKTEAQKTREVLDQARGGGNVNTGTGK